MNCHGKKRFSSLIWRMKAALKKAMKKGNKAQLKFQYDPSSYALNFDDGDCKIGAGADASKYELQYSAILYKNDIWVYVLWVKSE